MNFSFDASKAQQPTMNPQTPVAGTQGFTAGTTGAGDAGKMLSPGFSLPSMQPQAKPGGGLFGSTLSGGSAPLFGSPATAPGLSMTSSTPINSGLTFGAQAAPQMGLNFGATPATSTAFGASGFTATSLAAPATSAASGLAFAVQKPAAAPAATGFSLGSSAATPATSNAPKLTFGVGSNQTTPASSGFALGGATSATPVAASATTGSSFGLPAPAATSAPQTGLPTSSTGFSLAPTTPAQPIASGFGIPQTTGSTASTTASTGFSLGGNPPATLASGFNLGSSAAPTVSTGFALNKTTTTTTPAATSAAANAPQTSLGTITTVSSAATGQAGTMNFCQLEESINKWTLELEEQEKAFVNQATQVNNWDKLLIANGEKIATLNQEVERVKLEQQQLEHELDYVVGQQKELQDCLVPLEKELAALSVADPERDYTYRLAENLDKQIKTMSQDLKEIIEHLNEANRSQDSSDPIVQIGKILNAHMNSLQWLDQRTSVIGQKIQQIDQMHQNFRQENERSFSLAYN